MNHKPFGQKKRDGGWNIYEKSRKSTTKAKSIWFDTKFINEQGTIESGKLQMSGVLQFPKPLELMKQCIVLGTEEDDIILDFLLVLARQPMQLWNLMHRKIQKEVS